MRQRAGLFAGLMIVATVAVGTAAGIVGLLSSAATTGVRTVLEAVPGAELALRAALPLAAGSETGAAAEQDRAATATIQDSFRDGSGRSIPLSIVRTVESVSAVASDGGRTSVGIAEAADIDSAATLADGEWASDASQATMQADAAAALGVGIGDTVVLDDEVELTIVGTWRVNDPDSPHWMGDPLWTTGSSDRSIGPIIVDTAVWNELGITPQVKWTIIPEIGRLAPADLAAADAAWDTMPAAFRAAGLGVPSLTGRFLLAARESQTLVAALQIASPLALVVLGAIAALAIWELAGLLARTRAAETSLLWARGATPGRLAATTAGEAAAVVAVGAALGTLVTVVALGQLPDASRAALIAGAGAGLVAVAISAGAFALRTAGSAGSVAATSARGQRRERAARSTAAGVLALVAAAAIVCTWQLLTSGPITTDRTGRAGIDPITLVAPALILAAIVLAALFVFPLLAQAAEAPAARGAGPVTVLAVRGVARRAESAAVPIVMVGLAVGQLIVAAGFGATWAGAFSQSQELRFGAALSLSGPSGGLTDADLDAVAAQNRLVAPIRLDDVLIGGEHARLVGAAAGAVAELGLTGDGTVDPAALATAIAPDQDSLLPEDATSISVSLAGADSAAISVWLSDAAGRLRDVSLETTPTSDGLVGTAPLPAGTAPWRLAAVDVTPASTDADIPGRLIVTSIETDAGALGMLPDSTAVFRNGLPVTPPGTRGGPATAAEAGTLARFLPPPPVGAVVLSEPLAERLGTRVGAPLTLEVDDMPIQTSVADIVAAIPGADESSGILIDAALVDAAHLAGDAQPRADSVVWVGARGDLEAAASAVRGILPASVTVHAVGEGPDRAMLAAGPMALWLAALACAALAIAGLIAACAMQLRERRPEVAVLRALGLPPRAQSALRRRELAIVEVWAIAAGAIAGLAVVLLVVATLARAAVPRPNSAVTTAVHLDLAGAAAATALLGVILFAIIAGYSAVVARSAARGIAPEGST
ncbi:FtsX-like permease family protein [Microbacterium sp. cf046]|uniref:FtsX-like permease family protein n=1 Tax=Microbacterium sp. cf046 TaxID=1761803 RepID=UPI000B84DEE3|nr:FtsX-like permease family protein [Microbacterium sp. cf046]